MGRAPEAIERVELSGEALTIEEVVAVARHGARVALAPAALARVRRCRRLVEVLLERGEKVYGLTTGFGKLRDVSIAPGDVERLQVNLIRSHAAGVGSPFDEDVVRAAVLLRANTLCRGHSGPRQVVLEALVALLNDGLYPFVPQQGSVGCSGDLAPLSHLALVLMGDPGGRVYERAGRPGGPGTIRAARPEEFTGCEGLDWARATAGGRPATFRPLRLEAKEGLALNNGTQFMTALACLALHDAGLALAWSEAACAMSLEAQRGVRNAFRPELHRVRDLPHQAATAARIVDRTAGSEVLDVLLNTASLRRARTALVEVREHLLAAGLGRAGPVAGAAAGGADEVHGLLDALVTDLLALAPPDEAPGAPPGSQAEARPDPRVLAHAGAPPRAQIDGYTALVAPLRRRAAALLERLDREDLAAPPFARDAVVRALSALGHAVPPAPPVQDDYSLRCAAQVLACTHRALAHTRETVEVEINAATDNPLLFPPAPPPGLDPEDDVAYARWLREPAVAATLADLVLGGGNFHGEPIAKVMDYLAIAVAEVGSLAERRVAHLVDEALSNGLPPFLIESSGLNSGFMIPQYTAAALVSENKVLCHPASVDSIPTCAGSEDHVSMGTIAARKAALVVENVCQVVAIELLAAYQGLGFRRPLRPGRGVQAACAALEAAGVTRLLDDRVLAPEIARARALLRRPPPA